MPVEKTKELADYGLKSIEINEPGEIYFPNQEGLRLLTSAVEHDNVEDWCCVYTVFTDPDGQWVLNGNNYRADIDFDTRKRVDYYGAYMLMGLAKHCAQERWDRNIYYSGDDILVFDRFNVDKYLLTKGLACTL